MGKSTALDEEGRALGEAATSITARHFATFDADHHPEWKDKTLFIDGLDEIRTGTNDPRGPIDQIRRNLDKLGKPRFRLSCRHADWLDTDRRSLEAVCPSGEVTVLRLDPLDETRTAQLLRSTTDVANVTVFVRAARERGLEGMLTNPQSLTMLARAVGAGHWPETRLATFEQACRAIATEHNEEHLSVRPETDPDQTLDAAGRLCAALLIAGRPGCAITITRETDDYPYVAKCGYGEQRCRAATTTKLFRYPAQGLAEPVHRHIAEYLGARHIASLIESGLPVGRAVALMSAPDGKIASELRGLSAWLAASSPLARRDLIDRDAIGVALYGDIHAFSVDEKQALFDSLVREPRQLEPTERRAPAFASLATPAMRDVIERLLLAPPDDGDEQFIVDFVLAILREARPLDGFTRLFLDITRDHKRWPRIRHAALDALIHYGAHDNDLLALLQDIQGGAVDDPNDELLGQLLSALYPGKVGPSAVWDYAKDTNERHLGAYRMFWAVDLPVRSSDQEVADCLNECHSRLAELERENGSLLEPCTARLLVRALRAFGDDVVTPRLYDWLDTGVRLGVGGYRSDDTSAEISHWIAERPETHIDLVIEGLSRRTDDLRHAPYEVFRRFFNAEVPQTFYESCIQVAGRMAESAPGIAESLLVLAIRRGGLEPTFVGQQIGEHSPLAHSLVTVSNPMPTARERQQEARQEKQELRDEERHRFEYLKANEAALRENRAPTPVLHQLAGTYFDSFLKFTPKEGQRRLKELVHQDAELLDAVVAGLRLARDRDDLPDVDAILALRRQSRIHTLCWPYLASLAEAERVGSLGADWRTTDHARTALVIYLGYPHGTYEPSWYQDLVEHCPETVAGVQIKLAGESLRDGIDPVSANLWHLAFDPDHTRIAHHASIPLLRKFPPRAGKQLLHVLDHLLLAAFQHADRAAFQQLIERKLSRKSLPASHRGRWLAAGCAVAPARYEHDATAFATRGRREERTLHLASFFCPQQRPFAVEVGGARLAALLLRLVGRIVGPEFGEGFVTPAMAASRLVRHCVGVLANDPAPEATRALGELQQDAQLSQWHRPLAQAADDQQVIRRDSEYRNPTIEQAAETLSGGLPTGPADLAAFVLDRLGVIAQRIRWTDSDDWKQHWNEDQYGRPTKPKREESCTRAILSDLRGLLPDGVDAQPESRYSNDSSADIRVSHGASHVPIEVKRNGHRDLWRALRTQLIAKYTRDAGTGGRGLYVVLWFGRELTQRSPTGERPSTPDELREQLEDTLTHAERHTVSICVIDVSPVTRKPLVSK